MTGQLGCRIDTFQCFRNYVYTEIKTCIHHRT